MIPEELPARHDRLAAHDAVDARQDAEYWKLRAEQTANLLAEQTQRAEEAEAKIAALMDERGAEEIDRIQAERDALPEDERARLDAADAPMLRIQLAGMARKVAEVRAELDRTSSAAAREIWHKMGMDTLLHWKEHAEQAERERDEAHEELRRRRRTGNPSSAYSSSPEPATNFSPPKAGTLPALSAERDEALAAAERVRDLCARMRTHPNTRKWADRIEAALDQPEQPRHTKREADTWTIAVQIPATLPSEMRDSLFTAVANTVSDWEPNARDGWDAIVRGHPTAHTVHKTKAEATVNPTTGKEPTSR